jgi:hypothetical protein
MRKIVLVMAAAGEAGAGLILLANPLIPVQLLSGAEISGPGILMSRILGTSLIGLGVACWPGKSSCQPLYGMLTYSILAMLCLAVVGVRGEGGGVLLWPAVGIHAILSVLLGAAWWGQRESSAT